jgi:hypothetical protein
MTAHQVQPWELHRRTDPATSRHAAYEVVESGRNEQIKQAILHAMRDLGGSGLTAGEIGDLTGIDGVWKRCSELERDGKLVTQGTRIWAGSGKAQRVYFLAGARQEPMQTSFLG